MDSVGESAKHYFFFDKNCGLDLQMVVGQMVEACSLRIPLFQSLES